ncbi:kelch domain containing 2, isoform CRA_d [Rattus norvegicus]|uniref:Kelch domain containing 2, isoform CRA_d n=1 Tax=Rattus norvegicus TaxID=10116 RepID=A6HBV6_RAT|nr:kelch domain containing 2, isoform CRA_d [Rattus norvegicus]
MADGNEDARAEDMPGPAFEGYEAMELACPAERSGHVAVSDGRHMFVWGGYKSNQVRGLYDFYLPREELWIYNMETGRWKKINTEGDVPPSMSGSCAVCVDRVLYLFGGHHSRGNTNKGKAPSPRAAHACATVGNKGFVFGGRYRVMPGLTASVKMNGFSLIILMLKNQDYGIQLVRAMREK